MTGHINFDADSMELRLLDQRVLPGCARYHICRSCQDVVEAIKDMVVRGAPAIGVSAAYGCVLAAHDQALCSGNSGEWRTGLEKSLDALAAARPTAVNLGWAINRMKSVTRADMNLEQLMAAWLGEALHIQKEDYELCRKIGFNGAALINDGDTVLTHCNAGALATAGYGTALGVIRAAVETGKSVRVIADETRPFLQGARLTAYELQADNIPVTVACDNACALLMARGMVQLAIVGADRVAANGDTANKIGTLGAAIIARHFHIPFYVACPLSTVDVSMPDGSHIPIETRPDNEVTHVGGAMITPENIPVYNFAFDVTPAELVSGIITEAGILRPPFDSAIKQAFAAGCVK